MIVLSEARSGSTAGLPITTYIMPSTNYSVVSLKHQVQESAHDDLK